MKKSSFIVLLALSSMSMAQEIQLESISVEADSETEFLEEKISKKTSSLAKEVKGETLGDFLENEQFVDSASYGPAVGRPVVRGMDGYRVGVTNGNIILNDLSAMSQDHAVGVMARASQKIELIKGPSSLLYGNYSGGVIRVLGEEHEKELLKNGYSLDTTSSYGSNGAGLVLGTAIKASDSNVSLFVNTFYHDAENYTDGNNQKVKDSKTTTRQSHAVLGYQINEQNIIKMYYDTLNKDYGIPNSTDKPTTIEMEQNRYGVIWHAKDFFDTIKQMQTEIQSSDYLHSELEGVRADGLFGQKLLSVSTMLDFDLGSWQTTANIEYQNSELQVCHEHGKCTNFFDAQRTSMIDGVELQQNIDNLGLAYSHGHPMPNISESLLKAGVSANKFVTDDTEVTLALRADKREINPDNKNIQEVWLVTPQIDSNYYDTIEDTALSASMGVASFLNNEFSFQSSLSYVERLPSSTELFWNGFHHATDSYIFGERYLSNEKSLNFDIDTMLSLNPFTTQLSAFYYHFYNYIYQEPLASANGLLVRDPFHQSDVWAIRGVGAKMYGVAMQESYKKEILKHQFDISFNVEAIRGVLFDNSNLPRIPTFSSTFAIGDSYKEYKAKVSYKYIDESRFEAKNETYTPSYSWLSAFISYDNKTSFCDYSLYLKGENLTNEIAYNHLSFLKATAPLSGRQITLGLDMKF